MIFVLVVAFAWLPPIAYLVAPGPSTRALTAFEGWLRRHRKKVLVGAGGLIGVLLVAEGIAGLV